MSGGRAGKAPITSPPPLVPENIPSREGVLQALEWSRQQLQQKLQSGRFRDPEAEKLRDAKTRLLIYNCQVLAGVLKDAELEEIKQRIEQLEQMEQRKAKPRQNHTPDNPLTWNQK